MRFWMIKLCILLLRNQLDGLQSAAINVHAMDHVQAMERMKWSH